MNGDGDRRYEAEPFAVAEGDANALGERVDCHQGDEEERLAGIGAGEGPEVGVLAPGQQPRGAGDEEHADEGTADRAQRILAGARVEEKNARGQHEPRRERVGQADLERARRVANRNGAAPSPVASAVASAAAKMASAPGTSMLSRGCWAGRR